MKQRPKSTEEALSGIRAQDAQKLAKSSKAKRMALGEPKSVRPCATDETISKTRVPGASQLAAPKAKAHSYDAKMDVDRKKDEYLATARSTQRGGHNRKK